MNRGWAKLHRPGGKAVFVWAVDAEMVAETDLGCIVYLHHDKIEVRESATKVLERIDAIREKTGFYRE